MTIFIGKEVVTQSSPHDVITRYLNIDNLRVLEIGGNQNCEAAKPFVSSGASKIIVTGLDDVSQDKSINQISIAKMDALFLSDHFSQGYFDIVYGVSVLEHIPNPKKLFREIYYILSEGGMVYLEGEPIWTGPWGHHVWIDNWRDNTIGSYHFLPYPNSNSYNPIPDWGHLLYDEKELHKILLDSGVAATDIEPIIYKIYHHNHINRETINTICGAIKESGLLVREIEVNRAIIDKDILNRLRRLHGSGEDYSINGVRVVLQKGSPCVA
jgi:SAM-dependent methyltransferase